MLGSHMLLMIGESLSIIILLENSQRILLVSNNLQWTSPMSATYEDSAQATILNFTLIL